MSLEVVEQECIAPIDYIGKLPNEMLNHVLAYLSFEEIDNLRLVNQNFKNACNYLLKKNYYYVKQQIALCNEKTRSLLINDQLNSSKLYYGISFDNYINRIFWFVVNEFLDNSFGLFDLLKGYLNRKYSVNGKTLDVVRRILWLKETDDPLSLLAEMILGRSKCHSNMKCFEDYGVAYCQWFFIKKYRGLLIEEIYTPIINGKQPGLDLPKYAKGAKEKCYSMVLDILTTLWTEELNMTQHRVLPTPSYYVLADDDELKVIPVLKLGQNPNPQLYVDYDVNSEEFLANDNNVPRNGENYYKPNHQLDLAFTKNY